MRTKNLTDDLCSGRLDFEGKTLTVLSVEIEGKWCIRRMIVKEGDRAFILQGDAQIKILEVENESGLRSDAQ